MQLFNKKASALFRAPLPCTGPKGGGGAGAILWTVAPRFDDLHAVTTRALRRRQIFTISSLTSLPLLRPRPTPPLCPLFFLSALSESGEPAYECDVGPHLPPPRIGHTIRSRDGPTDFCKGCEFADSRIRGGILCRISFLRHVVARGLVQYWKLRENGVWGLGSMLDRQNISHAGSVFDAGFHILSGYFDFAD